LQRRKSNLFSSFAAKEYPSSDSITISQMVDEYCARIYGF
jgi:hypothetical protein